MAAMTKAESNARKNAMMKRLRAQRQADGLCPKCGRVDLEAENALLKKTPGLAYEAGFSQCLACREAAREKLGAAKRYKPPRPIRELSPGELRKLETLRKTLSQELADEVFKKWARQHGKHDFSERLALPPQRQPAATAPQGAPSKTTAPEPANGGTRSRPTAAAQAPKSHFATQKRKAGSWKAPSPKPDFLAAEAERQQRKAGTKPPPPALSTGRRYASPAAAAKAAERKG